MENREVSHQLSEKNSNLLWNRNIITIISPLIILLLLVAPLGLNIFFITLMIGFFIIDSILIITDCFHYKYPHESLTFDKNKIGFFKLNGGYELYKQYEALKTEKQKRKFLFREYQISWFKRFNERNVCKYLVIIGTGIAMVGSLIATIFNW